MSKKMKTHTDIETTSNTLDSIWYEYPNSIKMNNIIFNVGDCIIYKSRELPVRIEKFVGYEVDSGPIGFEYLPWRGDRWGTPTWGLRGNPRFIICLPIGLPHYGQHIEWNTVQIVTNPVLVDPPIPPDPDDPEFRI
jgi:hypothetical protein